LQKSSYTAEKLRKSRQLLFVLTLYKALQYMTDCCIHTSDITRQQHLQSAGCRQLFVPRQQRSMFSRQSYSVADLVAWNSLTRWTSVSGTLCLSHYVTEMSHLYSLRDFWRHFGLCRAAAHSDCCFFVPCTNILTYLLTVFEIRHVLLPVLIMIWKLFFSHSTSIHSTLESLQLCTIQIYCWHWHWHWDC